jgi:hypothetical protein
MMRRAVLILLCWAAWPAFAGAQTLVVKPLTRDGNVLVSFELADVFTDGLRTAIQSGLTITFVYDVELKRGTSMWLDRTLATATVTASVRFDNLTRRYSVTLAEDGRIDRSDTTDQEDVARRWLTEFNRLPLFSSAGLEANGEYYLRVRARTTPKSAAFVWPWDRHDVSGNATFTFLK